MSENLESNVNTKRNFNIAERWKFVFSFFFLTYLTLIGLFSLIRPFNVKFLGFFALPDFPSRVQVYIAGFLSDVWMSLIISLLTLPIMIVLSLFQKVRENIFFRFLPLTILLFILSLHVYYVEFFGSYVSIAHVYYIFDPAFLSSSWNCLFDIKSNFVFLIAVLMMIIIHFVLKTFERKIHIIKMAIIIFFVSIFSQIAKVQYIHRYSTWAQGEILLNFIENLFLQSFQSKPKFYSDDYYVLYNWHKNMGERILALREPHIDAVKELIEGQVQREMREEGKILKNSLKLYRKNQKPIYVWIILLESFRPEEGAFFYPNQKSYSHFYDKLAKDGMSFHSAWSSGGVTRAGQEASLCGLGTGEYTSAMRTLTGLKPQCLYSHFKKNDGLTAFWHGGDPQFDRQKLFWEKHSVDHLVFKDDFPADSASTSWGLSDRVLFQKIKDDFLKFKERQLQFHAVLTVTNHIAWALPEDAKDIFELYKDKTFHASQLTTAYTDKALEEFVTYLKTTRVENESIWDHSLIFLMNDHGSMIPSLRKSEGYVWGKSEKDDLDAAEAMSRMGLIVSGGIVENNGSLRAKAFYNPVSQVDVYATIMDLFFDDEASFTIGDSIFAKKRRWPVVVDLGERVFVPLTELSPGLVMKRKEMLTKKKHPEPYLNTAMSFFRANQVLLYSYMSGSSLKKNTK